jgi:peptidoglycan hydrolase-like protein with peptidoglycan-binding domain
MDGMVQRAQQFVNNTYVARQIPGIPRLEEDGKTSWAVMYALTRCLQYELGITSLSDAFGPTTLSTLQSRWPSIDDTAPGVPSNVIRIIQSGLYCKGYDGGGFTGTYQSAADGVMALKADAGITGALGGSATTPKVFKAILNMDPYVVVSGGSDAVRSIQQWMNTNYLHRRNFFVIPCDGHFSRDVQKALMFAIQYGLGMSDDVANGNFGPGTQSGLRSIVLGPGSSGTWVQLFSAAMIFNKRVGLSFTSTWDANLTNRTTDFQNFCVLPATGRGDFQTWASLLVSTGDPTRRGQAVDCVTEITAARAATLRGQGYQIVGRYLSNVPRTTLNKKIQPGELATIVNNGLRYFPIYQTYGGEASYFNFLQGVADGSAAVERARSYGMPANTRIYFAVDFDALDHQVTSNILPHFEGIKSAVNRYGQEFRIGVYGPRNVCSRVGNAGLTTASFVSGMSTGFSGNLGYPLPVDWAFDQISTITVGSGTGAIEIDNDIVSGIDRGQDTYRVVSSSGVPDVRFDMSRRDALLADVRAHLEANGIPEEGTGTVATEYAQPNTTTEAVDLVLRLDNLFTPIAQALGIRKALVQVPVLWEWRKYNLGDPLADLGVRAYHGDLPLGVDVKFLKNDSSTGIGQIFAKTAIEGTNHLITLGRVQAPRRNPAADADLWATWQELQDDRSNIEAVAHTLIYNAVVIKGGEGTVYPYPDLNDYPDAFTQMLLQRYRGSGPAAQHDSAIMVGLYQILERHNAPLRA